MSQFVVSARKYRPIRFEDVVGQQHVWQTLKNAIRQQHLAQAFLFCGPRGVGKTTCARILAKVLNCERPTEDIEPCDECPSCKAFQENASLNIHELDAASNNSVEHIRALIDQVRFPPQRGRYKIYIIDEVHMLSQAAFNAFLKTLEEPPSYAIFILATTEKHKILPTILSRCQIFEFHRIMVTDMMAHLGRIAQREGIEAEEDALNIIAQKADGGLRDALSIFDRIVSFCGNQLRYENVIENLNILDYDFYFRMVDAIAAEDYRQLILLFDEVLKKGFEGDLFMGGLAEHLRNVLMCQDPRTAQLLEVGGNVAKRYQAQARTTPSALLLTCLNLCNECDIYYKTTRNKRLHVELYLMKMAYAFKRVPVQPLTADEKKKPELGEAVEEKAVVKTVEEPAPPAVVQSEEDKAAAFKRKLAERKGGGDLLEKAKQEVEQQATKPKDETPALPYTLEQVQALWEEYMQRKDLLPVIQSNGRLVRFELEEGAVLMWTGSTLLESAMKQELAWAEVLRKAFQRPQLKVLPKYEAVEVGELEKAKPPVVQAKALTDRDKYRLMLQKNPNLKELQRLFELVPKDAK